MSKFEQGQTGLELGKSVHEVSHVVSDVFSFETYKESYIDLVKGTLSDSSFQKDLAHFSPNDALGKTLALLRKEFGQIYESKIFPTSVLDGIASVWQSLAVVWMHEQSYSRSIKTEEQHFTPLTKVDQEEIIDIFPLDRFLKESKLLTRVNESKEWNRGQRIKYAGILLDADFYKGYEFLKESDPETYKKIFRGYTVGAQIGWNRYAFLEKNKFFSTQA